MEQNQQQSATSKVHRSSEQILDCLKEQRQSKLTIKEYCLANAISQNTFYRWQKIHGKQVKRRHKKERKNEGGFATIEVTGNLITPSSPQLFAEIGDIRLYKEVPAEYLKALLS